MSQTTTTDREDWAFFPCEIDGRPAYIAFDEALAERLDGLPQRDLLKLRIKLRAPQPDGLPGPMEFSHLVAMENALVGLVRRAGGAYAGRISVADHRHLHFFVDAEAVSALDGLDEAAARYGYTVDYALGPDPDREGYWDTLFPTDDDRQVMRDLRSVLGMRARSETLDKARKIDHSALFPTAESADVFSAWLRSEGWELLRIDPVAAPAGEADGDARADGRGRPKERWLVEFRQLTPIVLEEITQVTVPAARAAQDLGGQYRGWRAAGGRRPI